MDRRTGRELKRAKAEEDGLRHGEQKLRKGEKVRRE